MRTLLILLFLLPLKLIPLQLRHDPAQDLLLVLKNSEFSYIFLKEYINTYHLPYDSVILQQAIWETGHFTSNLFKNHNNLFGMKLAKSRKTTAYSSYRGYAVYSHWTKSVDDYILWLKNKKQPPKGDYYQFLISSRYAEDSLYIHKLKQIKL